MIELIKKNFHRIIEFIKFCVVGVLMTALNWVLYYWFVEFASMHYLASNIISYAIAVVVSYFVNLRFTFTEPGGRLRSFIDYIVMRAAVLGADSLILYLFVDVLGQDVYLSKILVTGILFLVTFSLSRRILVNKEPRQASGNQPSSFQQEKGEMDERL